MSSVVDKFVVTGQLNAEQVERIGENVRDFIKAAQENPDLLEEAKEKFAKIPWGHIRNNILMGGAMTAGGLGIAAGADYAGGKLQAIRDDKSKAKHYKAMLDASLELSESGVDATLMQRHFNTLYRFNPEYAKDPMVAAAYVDQSMESAKPSIGVLNELVSARKNIIGARQGEKSQPSPSRAIASAGTQFVKAMGFMGGAGAGAKREDSYDPESMHELHRSYTDE